MDIVNEHDQVGMSAEHVDCFKYATKENIISVIKDWILSEIGHLLNYLLWSEKLTI